MQRYFTDQMIQTKVSFSIAGDNFHHLVRVMRAKVNDQAEFVSKKHEVFIGKIERIDPQEAHIMPIYQLEKSAELPVEVTIACGISKGDKSEYIVQKGTEMGARNFIFLPTEFSVARWPEKKATRKVERLQKVAKSAAEQSHRNYIPTVTYYNDLQTLSKWPGKFKLVAYEESAKHGEHTQLHAQIGKMQPNDTALVLFGPEGGLANSEVESLRDVGFVSVGLGPRILRAETAPLYLLSAISVLKEMR
ncbi:16S rRNA (uracil(1498)-N(3))-methyltransferase [Pediococcus parvulus]|uniref:16S rRNA (uracil(1498)-N(3))-methyltransferase n=1 Tax=Pediococcus parvulus TaxID=54062 RepID=UPI00345E7E83